MASVRKLPSGSWQARAYVGRDPLTGREKYLTRTLDKALGQRAAKREADRFELELRDGLTGGKGGTFGALLNRYASHSRRSMAPSSADETDGIIRRYLAHSRLATVPVERVTTEALDDFYDLLAQRGGACRHRPCPRTPCPRGRARCEAWKTCVHPPCAAHKGECADWVPCEHGPCPHGGPLDVATVARTHNVVRAALAQGVAWGWVRRNVAEHADPGEVLEDEVDPPAAADIIRLLAEVESVDPRLADHLAVSIETGARRGAVGAMRWSYVDLDARTLRFPRVLSKGGRGVGYVERPASRTKSTARRQVAISDYLVARLLAHRARMEARAAAVGATLPADAFVWSDDVLGRVPWRPDSTSRKVREVRGAAGLDSMRLHDLRHAMASLLLAARIAPNVVAERGGWRRAAVMLDRYAHALPATDREAADHMGLLFAAPARALPEPPIEAELVVGDLLEQTTAARRRALDAERRSPAG